MSKPVLKISDAEVTLGGKTVLSGVSLDVQAGTFTAIVGPNGSGKTSLLRAIYRAIDLSKGSVSLFDCPIGQLSRVQLGKMVGVLRQEPPLQFDFLVEELVALGRAPHKALFDADTKEDRAIIEEAMALTDVSALKKRSFATLSGGEKQRVLLARALAQRPRLLLLDEPTNHLDVRHQLEVLACVRKLGLTTIAALHDLNLVFGVADQVLMLSEGRTRAVGTPEEVVTPENVRAAFGVEAEKLSTRDARTVLAFRT